MPLQSFQAFYQENLGLIYRFVYGKLGNTEEAEDVTSQVFIKALRGLDYAHDPRSARKWLFQVARTTISDYWRVNYRPGTASSSLDALLEAGWEGPAAVRPAQESSGPADLVRHILQALTEREREVLTCRFLLNLSLKETALRMSMTEQNVKIVQFRALKRAASIAGMRRETSTS
jgi:RNA polymerase sigma-70 factor, ECF subfamily